MTRRLNIEVSLKQPPDNDRYRELFCDFSDPIFVIGDLVAGSFRFSGPRQGETLKHRGISVRLVRRTKISETEHEFCLQENKIDPGTITIGEDQEFTFNIPPIGGVHDPTYRGIQCQLDYFVVIEARLSVITKVSAKQAIVFLEPLKTPPVTQLCLINVSCRPPFDVLINKDKFANDELITGKVIFGKHLLTGLQSVMLNLVLMERSREGGQMKAEEVVPMYQLVDGTPKAEVCVPFVFQLAPLKLWVSKNSNQSLISTSYVLQIWVRRNDTTVRGAEHQIHIYIRDLSNIQ